MIEARALEEVALGVAYVLIYASKALSFIQPLACLSNVDHYIAFHAS